MRCILKVTSNNFLVAERQEQTVFCCSVCSSIYWGTVECGRMFITFVTWPLAPSTKLLKPMFCFDSVPLSNFSLGLNSCCKNLPATSVCVQKTAWVLAGLKDGANIFKVKIQATKVLIFLSLSFSLTMLCQCTDRVYQIVSFNKRLDWPR